MAYTGIYSPAPQKMESDMSIQDNSSDAAASAFPPAAEAIVMATADSYVVVSWWQEKSNDGRKGDYQYEHCATQNEALDLYADYVAGEYGRGNAIGIFAARNGMPVGSRIDPAQLMRLVRETRRS